MSCIATLDTPMVWRPLCVCYLAYVSACTTASAFLKQSGMQQHWEKLMIWTCSTAAPQESCSLNSFQTAAKRLLLLGVPKPAVCFNIARPSTASVPSDAQGFNKGHSPCRLSASAAEDLQCLANEALYTSCCPSVLSAQLKIHCWLPLITATGASHSLTYRLVW